MCSNKNWVTRKEILTKESVFPPKKATSQDGMQHVTCTTLSGAIRDHLGFPPAWNMWESFFWVENVNREAKQHFLFNRNSTERRWLAIKKKMQPPKTNPLRIASWLKEQDTHSAEGGGQFCVLPKPRPVSMSHITSLILLATPLPQMACL